MFKFFFLYKNKYDNGNSILVNSKKKKNALYLSYSKSNFVDSSLLLVLSIRKAVNCSFFSLVKSSSGSFFVLKLINGLFLGDYVKNYHLSLKFFKHFILGSRCYLGLLLKHFYVSNVSCNSFASSFMAASDGTFCHILELNQEIGIVVIKLPSGNVVALSKYSTCTIGRNANISKKYEIVGKAGLNSFYAKKPIVRGVAKNPVDHPHGGRTKTNQPELSPWGWVTKYSH